MKKYILFTLMAILMLGGIPLILGEMQNFELTTFITMKCVGIVAVYASYVIYKTEFTPPKVRHKAKVLTAKEVEQGRSNAYPYLKL